MSTLATHPIRAHRTAASPRVLADVLAGSRAREAALVLGATALIIVAGRVSIPLPFTPVPISLATLAVLGAGATLGARRAAASAGLYLALGVAGAPVFADGRSGWEFASFGYIVGYVAAAVILGWLAQRGASRHAWSMAASALVGTGVVYICGIAWMMASLGLGLAEALALGALPFLAGDALKIAVLAGAVPAAWRLLTPRP